MKVTCEVCQQAFELEQGNYFVVGIEPVTFKCLYVHKECKASLAVIDGRWCIVTTST